MTTFAPRSASMTAAGSPILLLAPVIATTLSWIPAMKFYFHTSERSSVCPNYRVSSQIQFVSHVLPPSDEKDCSIRADFGEIFNQT